MDRRSLIFVFIGAVVMASIAFLVGSGLDPAPVACSSGGLLIVCTASRIHVLGIRLSEMEVIVWSIIVGATVGAGFGLLVDQLTRRERVKGTLR